MGYCRDIAVIVLKKRRRQRTDASVSSKRNQLIVEEQMDISRAESVLAEGAVSLTVRAGALVEAGVPPAEAIPHAAVPASVWASPTAAV